MTGLPVISRLEAIIAQEPVDEVLITLPREQYSHVVETIVRLCEEQGIIVRLRTEMFTLKIARWHVDEVDGMPMVTIRSGPTDGWPLMAKRLFDVCGSAICLLGLAPLFAILALLIKLDSPGPVFFRQERVGFHKRRFRVFKFRTMLEGAERQQPMLEGLNEADGPVFKIKHDPRITRTGKFLRRFSLDELPQLINVLKGEMSLVGPRPLPVRDVERIDVRWHKRRFSVKPGVTCLWQVNGRSDVDFARWVTMDLEYIDNWTLGLDLKILIRTIPAVFKGSGAY
ncbi:MAG TPA: sugar transferase [Alphaproteobacteria bacterium]|nr:sugar transferase [Alphaproteobacteria bacterium]